MAKSPSENRLTVATCVYRSIGFGRVNKVYTRDRDGLDLSMDWFRLHWIGLGQKWTHIWFRHEACNVL